MKAIILAAGVGARLGEISGGRPKSLLNFEGRSLLQRHIDNLNSLGIDEILVVTGFQREEIEAELDASQGAARITFSHNEQFRQGSVISLYCASDVLCAGEEMLLMDADVLYHPDILARLSHSRHDNCYLLDRDFVPGDEPVKICVRGNEMVEFRKRLDSKLQYDYQGESVGFFKFSADVGKAVAARCKIYIDEGRTDEPYEEILRDLLLSKPADFGFEDITGLAWIEIDFPEDVGRATNEILPAIQA